MNKSGQYDRISRWFASGWETNVCDAYSRLVDMGFNYYNESQTDLLFIGRPQ